MNSLVEYILRIGDDSLILGQRLAEWCGHGPVLEEDIAMTNIALDLIGQTTSLLKYAGEVEGEGRNEDDLAFLRYENQYKNALLVEQPNGDFAVTMLRQFFFDAFRKPFFEKLQMSKDVQLAAIAEKSLKETKYHLKHSSEWIIRLGAGTEESKRRTNEALQTLWRYTSDLFYTDEVDEELLQKGIAVDMSQVRKEWDTTVKQVFELAALEIPSASWKMEGGRLGRHTEHLGYILAELQYMQRAYPGMTW